jgi:hypothetical protein
MMMVGSSGSQELRGWSLVLRKPRLTSMLARLFPSILRGSKIGHGWPNASETTPSECTQPGTTQENPLQRFFDAHESGRGIWKWLHYFEVYHRHLQKFRGKEVHIVEIGVFSGGSLDLWRDYFGPQCHIYGVDINDTCKVYEDEHTRIFVGDQADRAFWQRFRKDVPVVDIVIDDGGHDPEQQIVTFEELLPHMRPGGVYVCEDIHGEFNSFAFYLGGLSAQLHANNSFSADFVAKQPKPSSGFFGIVKPTPLQQTVSSIHFYPYVTIAERTPATVDKFLSIGHGTEWQPDAFWEKVSTLLKEQR